VLLLALDTATPAVTVALHDGTRLLAEATAMDARRHGELLAPGIAEVLADAGADRRDLTDVAAGTGPGPFTGLRVGLVTGRTLALALDVRLHGVCTLDALAARALLDGTPGLGSRFVAATDARRREVYWAGYEGDDLAGLRRVQGPAVDRAADVPREGRPVVGRGAELYADSLGDAHGPLDPSGAAMAELVVAGLAAGRTFDELEPRYLRRPDVAAPVPRKSALR
jgi:tRNA threonylcarbamoyl adenosine modification protein YeaZ